MLDLCKQPVVRLLSSACWKEASCAEGASSGSCHKREEMLPSFRCEPCEKTMTTKTEVVERVQTAKQWKSLTCVEEEERSRHKRFF